jgi:hypothetical protein
MEKTLLYNNWLKFDSSNIDDAFKNKKFLLFIVTTRICINYLVGYDNINPKSMYIYQLDTKLYIIYTDHLWLVENVNNLNYDFNANINKISILSTKKIDTEKYLNYLLKKFKLLNKRDIIIKNILNKKL